MLNQPQTAEGTSPCSAISFMRWCSWPSDQVAFSDNPLIRGPINSLEMRVPKENNLAVFPGSIVASDVSVEDRFEHVCSMIREIAGHFHKKIGTKCISIYAWNEVAQKFELVAYPGVQYPEFHRGPKAEKDSKAFRWSFLGCVDGDEDKFLWCEDDTAWNKYLEDIPVEDPELALSIYRKPCFTDFRDTESLKDCASVVALLQARSDNGKVRKVGQIFFNVIKTSGPNGGLTDLCKGEVQFACKCLKPLLQNYQSIRTTLGYDLAELLMRRFEDIQGVEAHRVERLLESLCDSASAVVDLENGTALSAQLLGPRLAFTYSSKLEAKGEVAEIQLGSIIYKCVQDRRFYVNNNFLVKASRDQSGFRTAIVSLFSDTEHPIQEGSTVSKFSVVVLPFVYNGDVRALIVIVDEKAQVFKESQLKRLQSFEQFARTAFFRLRQNREHEQMERVFRSYQSALEPNEHGGIEYGNPHLSMKQVLSFFGAEWGTFWPLDIDGRPARNGLQFTLNKTTDVIKDDPDLGIRDDGFSMLLLEYANTKAPDEVIFFAIHTQTNSDTKNSYYAQLFSSKPFSKDILITASDPRSGYDCYKIYDGFYHLAFTHEQKPPMRGAAIQLNPNIRQERHTRLVFLTRDSERITGMVWLKFSHHAEINSWSRQYLSTLSHSLGEHIRTSTLELTLRSFNHLLPGLIADPLSQTFIMRNNMPDNEELNALYLHLLAVSCKSCEIQMMMNSVTRTSLQLQAQKVEDWLDSAIQLVTMRSAWIGRKDPDTKFFELVLESDAKGAVAGNIYFSILFNLLDNAKKYSLTSADSNHRRVVWVRKVGEEIVTCVANTCREPQVNAEKVSARVGFRNILALVRAFGGSFRWFESKEKYLREKDRNVPEPLTECSFFAEFTLTSEKETQCDANFFV